MWFLYHYYYYYYYYYYYCLSLQLVQRSKITNKTQQFLRDRLFIIVYLLFIIIDCLLLFLVKRIYYHLLNYKALVFSQNKTT